MVTDRPAAQRRRVKDAEYHAAKAEEREAAREAAKATRLATEGFGSEDDD